MSLYSILLLECSIGREGSVSDVILAVDVGIKVVADNHVLTVIMCTTGVQIVAAASAAVTISAHVLPILNVGIWSI